MNFKNLEEVPFSPSIYIKPKRFTYESKGKNYTWDFVEARDSVSMLLYHKSLGSFVFVRQFRIPLWYHRNNDETYKENASMGYIIELCFGLADRNLSLEEAAREECVEELGLLPKELEKIGDYYTGFGSGVNKQSFYYAEIDKEGKIAQGGGVDEEQIEAVYVKVCEYKSFIKEQIRTPLLDFAYLWSMKHHFKMR